MRPKGFQSNEIGYGCEVDKMRDELNKIVQQMRVRMSESIQISQRWKIST